MQVLFIIKVFDICNNLILFKTGNKFYIWKDYNFLISKRILFTENEFELTKILVDLKTVQEFKIEKEKKRLAFRPERGSNPGLRGARQRPPPLGCVSDIAMVRI